MKRAPGILPSARWLSAHGWAGLVCAIRHQPEAFAHIRQIRERKRQTRSEAWVPVAESLAKQSGMLPNPTWLRRNGYAALDLAMHKSPELFTHIVQKKLFQRKDWVVIAESLAKNHGKLPSPAWLERNGFRTLARRMCEHPSQFAHIEQERKRERKTKPQEQVIIAEKLAKRYGEIPHRKWLRTHGFDSLYRAMKANASLFSHLKQRNLWK